MSNLQIFITKASHAANDIKNAKSLPVLALMRSNTSW